MFKINVGTFEFKVVDRFFYCRYCKDFNLRCLKIHRSGVFYLIKLQVTVRDWVKPIYFMVGIGETEELPTFITEKDLGKVIHVGFSGATRYEHGYCTCGGWYSFDKPVFILDDDIKEKEIIITESEKVLIAELLNKNIKLIIQKLLDKNSEDPYQLLAIDWGIFEYLKPLFYVYVRIDLVPLPLGAKIEYQPCSFKAVFRFGDITLDIPKVSYKNIQRFEEEGIYYLRLPRNRIIAYGIRNGRRIVYHNPPLKDFIVGAEQYRDIVHATCRIKLIGGFYYFVEKLFNNRLGDILFLKQENSLDSLTTAKESSFDKIKVIEGEKNVVDGKIKLTGDRIVLYHPEHGGLELEGGEYVTFEVPYIARGHD